MAKKKLIYPYEGYSSSGSDADYEQPTKIITIKVEGGCVVDVENMPKGYKYRVDDADLEEYHSKLTDDQIQIKFKQNKLKNYIKYD